MMETMRVAESDKWGTLVSGVRTLITVAKTKDMRAEAWGEGGRGCESEVRESQAAKKKGRGDEERMRRRR